MNRLLRLTALLLALMMVFSTFAAAETSYQIGQMTAEQWQQMVGQAEDELYRIDEGDSGKEVTPEIPEQPVHGAFTPYADGTMTELIVSEDSVSTVRTTSGVAVLTHSAAGQWQMLVGDVWADISGENGAEFWVTPEMMHGMVSAEFRKALADGSFTQIAKVTVVEGAPMVLTAAVRDGENTSEESVDTAADIYSLQQANEGLQKHLITINYLFHSNSDVAANPYYAEISTTTAAFSATIKHPKIVGYQPVEELDAALPEGFDYDTTQVTIDNATIEGDVTINVYYEPAKVTYTINYWEERAVYTIDPATGEEVKYDLVATRTYTGLTESTVKTSSPATDAEQYWAKQHTPEGFMALLYDENVRLAADGSTVVDVYYQRLYYLMVFNLGGGYGVNPIYTKHGVEIGDVGEPERVGYRFKGWTRDKSATLYTDGYDDTLIVDLPDAMPKVNSTYYAVWEPTRVTYMVAYWLEDPYWVDKTPNDVTDDEGRYAYWGQQTISNVLTEDLTTVERYTTLPDALVNALNKHEKENFYYDHCSENVKIAGDGSTIVNVYYNRKEYKLRFYYAMSHEGNDGETEYKVVGGTTYWFGSDSTASVKDDEIVLLQQFSTGSYKNQTGAVDSEITLKDGVTGYTQGSVSPAGDSYTYHYIQFSAKYGADISTLWPVDVFNPVTTNANSNWSGDQAFVAGWNGEHHVWYSQKNDNETIKGAYNLLDYQLLWDYDQFKQYGDGENKNEVAFLCFWENGADINWSIPELYRYHIYVEALPNHVAEETDVVYKDKTYVRRTWYDTIDDSDPKSQTEPAIPGFTGLATRGSQNKLTGGYNSVQVVNILSAESNGKKDVTKVYERATVANGKLTAADANKFKTIEEEISLMEIYAGGELTDRDGDGVVEANEREPLYNDAYFMYFYYDRQKFNLIKNNGGRESAPITLLYEQSLSDLGAAPEYPTWLYPEDAYIFDGWYTSATFEPETKVDFETATMPAGNMSIYANWVPVTHSVKVYQTKEEAAAGGTPKWHFEKVRHGLSTASSYTFDNPNHFDPDSSSFEPPTMEGMTFTLWYYIDENGDPKAFSFNSTPITEDTIVYAGWTASKATTYTIYYVLEGTDLSNKAAIENPANWVANPTTGSGLVGATTTERAKGGTELYDGTQSTTGINYQEGYFPTLESHSFTLNVDASKNVYGFEYKTVNAVPYQVHYVTAENPGNGAEQIEIDGIICYKLSQTKKVTENSKAVVTENYLQVGENYVPDAFQKRLILEADSTIADNVIVFYYTRDVKRTTVEINHYLVNADDNMPALYNSVREIVALPYTTTVTPETIANYAYDENRTTRKVSGGEAKLDPSLEISLQENAEGLVLNLYYVEQTVDINYIAVGPENAVNFGTVTPITENVGVVTGMPGSIATAGAYYTLTGWYSDAACTVRVGSETTYIPAKVDGVHVEATYYAKFEENEVTLNYAVATGCEHMGTVAPTSETLKILSGEAEGSVATAETNYEFVGWYATADGSGEALFTNVQYAPTKAEDVPWVDGTTYYAKFKEKQATINYVIVGLTGCGTVYPASENVYVLNGIPAGSAAAANATFAFVGWYLDEGCMLPVNPAWVVNDKIMPVKDSDAAWPDVTTYYAKFEQLPGQLGITKKVVNNTGKPLTVTKFEFTVTLKDQNGDWLTGEVTYTINGAETTRTLTDGAFTLELDVGQLNGTQDGETASEMATVLNLPHGTQYTVTESHVDDCLTEFDAGWQGTISAAQMAEAKFTNTFPAPTTTTLTVKKTGLRAGESAIIKVEVDGKTYMLSLSNTHGSDTIVNLPVGADYTVTELNAWTWQYDVTTAQTGAIAATGSTVTITNTQKTGNWMHDESSIINDLGTDEANKRQTPINNQ